MDTTIPRTMLEDRLNKANARYERHKQAANECHRHKETHTEAWHNGAMFGIRREIDTLEILLEVADDIAHGVYSIAQ